MKRKILQVFILILLLVRSIHSQEITLELITTASYPIDVRHAGDNRIFIAEQAGTVMTLNLNGANQPALFLDITDRVLFGGEQGLLGIAFDPNYQSNGYFYVNYIRKPDGATVISRFQITTDANRCDPLTEKQILIIYQPYPNHNGGHIAFGPDGYLYIGMGDGGSAGDPENRAQNLDSLLGKMLRIDVSEPNIPYKIPANNPFVGVDGRDEIWDYGLRNPWGWSFDKLTGDLWIADVGQNLIEEINLEIAQSGGGLNYGWRCYEGNSVFNNNSCSSIADYTFPIYTYGHIDNNCSVIGGFRYRGKEFPNMYGNYFYGDLCNGYIQYLTEVSPGVFSNTITGAHLTEITAFGEDKNGEIYVTTSNAVYQIVDTASITGITDIQNPLREFVFYPNNENNSYTLAFQNAISQEIQLSITNLLGKTVFNSKQFYAAGDYRIPIELKNVQEKILFLRLSTEAEAVSRKFMVK